jgi:PemK-like, MazF-like toxin of type II toxin-antitoxin system
MSFVRRLKNVFTSTTASEPPDEQSGIVYAPEADGEPDPGEVVWGWVPYEDDPSQGKDRPVILLGQGTGDQEGSWLGLGLTSKDHDRDADQEAGFGRYWMDVGSGGWDREGRPSEVRLDRLLVLAPAHIRREGSALDQAIFEAVVAAARRHHALP